MPFIEIKLPTFNRKGLEDTLLRAFSKRARLNEEELRSTTEKFDTVKPVFQSEVAKVSGSWEIRTGPIDDGDDFGRIWSYLNDGTEVRHALMSGDFEPKTQPGTFETQSGQGGRAFLSKDIRLPGIEARDWTGLLAEENQELFANESFKAIDGFVRDWAGKASKIIGG